MANDRGEIAKRIHMKQLVVVQTPVRIYPAIGGVEQYALDLSKELAKMGHRITIICANEPKSDIYDLGGVKIKRLDYIFKVTNTNICLGLFLSLFREDFDLIHTHFPTPWSADISMLVARIKSKPLIVTYHNDALKNGVAGLLASIYNLTFLKLLLSSADKIIITQHDYLNRSKYLLPYKGKIEVIPNGVDTKLYSQQGSKKKFNQIFFLSVLDKYHRYKGLDVLLNAIATASKQISNLKLIVGGKGELVSEYKILSKSLGIQNNVEFIGYVSQERLINLYSESSLFILPSTEILEGFGIVLLEAMACATAVICTDLVGVSNDVVEKECGYVVKANSQEELAKSIIKVLKNPKEAIRMGMNGRTLVRAKYDLKKTTREVERIYREVLV